MDVSGDDDLLELWSQADRPWTHVSTRTLNAVRREGVRTRADLAAMSAGELLGIHHFGVKCLDEVRFVLAVAGLALRGEEVRRG